MTAEDPARLNLEVYDMREGLWHPEHGDVELPQGWEFLPSGEAFLTRRVKAGGAYWVVWRPRGRNREHRRKLGLFAPARAIAQARSEAAETAERRVEQRAVGARRRDRLEVDYRAEFTAAVLRWLDFAPEHEKLAEEIALGAAEQAAVVGSGRVGRTKTLTLDERAALAARAFIRHRHTDYEHQLVSLDPSGVSIDDLDYRDIKHDAQHAVDAFLDTHRQR